MRKLRMCCESCGRLMKMTTDRVQRISVRTSTANRFRRSHTICDDDSEGSVKTQKASS